MVDGRWKMEDCNLGSAVRVAHASRVLANPSRVRGLFEDRFGVTPKVRAGLAYTRDACATRQESVSIRVIRGPLVKKNAGPRFTRDPAFSRVSNQTKAELCVTVVFFELWFLSIPKSSRHVQALSID